MRSLFALFLIGCTSSALPSSTDGGPDNDGSTAADLAGATCGDISSSVSAWLAAHQSCTVDDDCVILTTACGLPNMCGGYANTGADGPYLQSLLAAWNADHCSPWCDCPAGLWPMPGCNHGVCGPRMAGNGPVGTACAGASDCQPGLDCVTPARDPKFTGGYCTLPNCNSLNGPCPSGSDCKDVDGTFYCLARCTDLHPDCRAGYGCCSGPGPSGGGLAWCSPASSILCLAN